MKIGIAGGGAFGTALGVALALDGHDISLWARNADVVAQMQNTRTNARLPGVMLPDRLHPTGDLQALFSCQIILLAIPA
ncbi:MAG: 2-dehydropantoate 2-reductase N-terminal domain-containing protein, partial [Pseudomonadota bacterium]